MTINLELVDHRRTQAAANIEAEPGQVFTPRAAADLVASMIEPPKLDHIRVLDPGAGIGSLSASFVESSLRSAPRATIELVAVERDERLLPALQETMSALTGAKGVSAEILHQDYLLTPLDSIEGSFDVVIMNPPYAKLAAKAPEREALRRIGVEVPNLYAAFMALGLSQLRPGGQLTAIVPRSFMNGTYFADFRRYLLENSVIRGIHTFESRNTVFADSGVLQESVIITVEAGGAPRRINIGVSLAQDPTPHEYAVDYEQVVLPTDANQFIRIPSEEGSDISADKTLGELGLRVATGKVVDFRARSYCLSSATEESVPLIYPGNLDQGTITWPRSMKRQKPQYFDARDDFSTKQVHPAGRYVIVKRFSSKEEARRVVAAVWDNDGPVAFENKTNVIGPIPDQDVAVGLSLWLNSTDLDKLFRTFSGHTQVNAGDLRALPIPDADTLRSWGKDRNARFESQECVDSVVSNQ